MSPKPDALDAEREDAQDLPWDGTGYRPLPPSGEEGAQTAFQDETDKET